MDNFMEEDDEKRRLRAQLESYKKINADLTQKCQNFKISQGHLEHENIGLNKALVAEKEINNKLKATLEKYYWMSYTFTADYTELMSNFHDNPPFIDLSLSDPANPQSRYVKHPEKPGRFYHRNDADLLRTINEGSTVGEESILRGASTMQTSTPFLRPIRQISTAALENSPIGQRKLELPEESPIVAPGPSGNKRTFPLQVTQRKQNEAPKAPLPMPRRTSEIDIQSPINERNTQSEMSQSRPLPVPKRTRDLHLFSDSDESEDDTQEESKITEAPAESHGEISGKSNKTGNNSELVSESQAAPAADSQMTENESEFTFASQAIQNDSQINENESELTRMDTRTIRDSSELPMDTQMMAENSQSTLASLSDQTYSQMIENESKVQVTINDHQMLNDLYNGSGFPTDSQLIQEQNELLEDPSPLRLVNRFGDRGDLQSVQTKECTVDVLKLSQSMIAKACGTIEKDQKSWPVDPNTVPARITGNTVVYFVKPAHGPEKTPSGNDIVEKIEVTVQSPGKLPIVEREEDPYKEVHRMPGAGPLRVRLDWKLPTPDDLDKPALMFRPNSNIEKVKMAPSNQKLLKDLPDDKQDENDRKKRTPKKTKPTATQSTSKDASHEGDPYKKFPTYLKPKEELKDEAENATSKKSARGTKKLPTDKENVQNMKRVAPATESDDDEGQSRSKRQRTRQVFYKEPALNAKMRR